MLLGSQHVAGQQALAVQRNRQGRRVDCLIGAFIRVRTVELGGELVADRLRHHAGGAHEIHRHCALRFGIGHSIGAHPWRAQRRPEPIGRRAVVLGVRVERFALAVHRLGDPDQALAFPRTPCRRSVGAREQRRMLLFGDPSVGQRQSDLNRVQDAGLDRARQVREGALGLGPAFRLRFLRGERAQFVGLLAPRLALAASLRFPEASPLACQEGMGRCLGAPAKSICWARERRRTSSPTVNRTLREA